MDFSHTEDDDTTLYKEFTVNPKETNKITSSEDVDNYIDMHKKKQKIDILTISLEILQLEIDIYKPKDVKIIRIGTFCRKRRPM